MKLKEDKKKWNEACIDALLWIGNAPNKYQTVDEFVKETQLRGCCRQLPFVPGWMKFGKTKVFLAHRDKYKTTKRGSIFGYFVLHRIEIITKNAMAEFLLDTKNVAAFWLRNISYYVRYINQWKKEKLCGEQIKIFLEEIIQRKGMSDIAKKDPDKIAQPPDIEDSIKRGEKEYAGDDWEDIKKLIMKIIEELIDRWLKRYKRDGSKCFPSNYSRGGEGHRMCSLRKGPGSVYAVDALCAAIHDKYQHLLRDLVSQKKKSGKSRQQILRKIQQENDKSWRAWLGHKKNHRWQISDLLARYNGPFYEAVRETFKFWQLKYPIDPRLKGKVKICGELAVFKRPFPILETAPRAAFRGIRHIDGNKLIEQIANHKGKKALIPKIYFCRKKRIPTDTLLTKQELSTLLAEELHITKTCANGFLKKLSLKAYKQLKNFETFRLPGIGTIRIQGEKLKKIKFYPTKAILQLRQVKSKKR